MMGKHTGFLEHKTPHRVCHYDDGNLAHLDVAIPSILHTEEKVIGKVANRESGLLFLGRKVRIVPKGQNASRRKICVLREPDSRPEQV
jgi:hypothetical protein